MGFLSRKPSAILVIGLLLGAVGCGDSLYPVRGRVTYPDGSPVAEGIVVFERIGQENLSTPRGEIGPDGSYEIGTSKPGDGALAGKYRVLVAPKYDPNAADRPAKQPPIDRRYSDFKTSGLEVEVKPGRNEIPLQVTSGQGRR